MTRTSCAKAGLGELKQAPDLVASSTICRWQKRDTRNGARHPRRPVVCPIPRWCPAILAEVIADVLNAAENSEQLAVGASVLGLNLAGKALGVAHAPVRQEPRKP